MARIKELFWQGFTLLFGLAVPIVLINFGPRLFGWTEGWSFVAGMGYWIVLAVVVFWWMSRDEPILGKVEDPILGTVTRRRSGWCASLDIPATGPDDDEDSIFISGGEAIDPSVMQLSTFVEIKDGWGQWVEELNQALNGHRDQRISDHPRELFYDRVMLSANEWAWSLMFGIERDDDSLDLVAHFKDGELTEVRVNSEI